VLISVGGANGSLALAEEKAKDNFVASMTSIIQEYGFDGIDINLESIPIIEGLREILTYLHVQHYNAEAMAALDGRIYSPGTADFHVAMAEMLLRGFPIHGNFRNLFPRLRPEQVVIGLPAFASAAGNGYTPPFEIQKALDYLTIGKSFGGQYTLRRPRGYPSFRGVMTWSINWDATSYQRFSTSARAVSDILP
jgi:chitinase